MLVKVNSADLKSVFQDVKPIFKTANSTAILGFTVENHTLYITCTGGIVYESQLVVERPGPYSLTVLYQDLSEIIPTRGVIDLYLEPLYVEIKGENMSAVLHQANGIVSKYRQRGMTMSKIDSSEIQQLARLFSETAPVSKSLQREAPVIFKPPYAIMKFPTFWLQCTNSMLDTVMDLQELKAVALFSPTEFGVSDDAIEFRRGPAIMAIARNCAGDCKFIENMLCDHNAAQTMIGGSYLPKVQQLLRSVGPGQCRCYVYTNGLELVVSRPKVQSNLRIGKCDTQIVVFPTFLEYVQMFFKIIGTSPIVITRGKSSVCLQANQIKMLLSVA